MTSLMIVLSVVCMVFVCFVVRHEARQRRAAVEHLLQLQASRQAISAAALSQDCGVGVPPDVAERVRRVLAAVSESALAPHQPQVDPDRLGAGDLLCDDLGYHLDSLAFFELLNGLEKEFGVRLRLRDLAGPTRIRDVVLLVASRRKSAM